MIHFRLEELMKEKGVTYREVSEGANVSTQTLYRMIKENPKMVGTEVIARLCKFFECKPNDLMVIVETDVGDSQ